MILDDLFEANLPPNIRLSDLPPGRRQKLTMKDIEAERPRGPYRYQVGDQRFMDLAAAQDFARGTRQEVVPLSEREESNQSSRSARIQRILQQMRARYPQAEDDLEALILNFRNEQTQDRQDINTLYSENDTEEDRIERMERLLQDLKQQRGLAEKRDPSPGKITKSEDPCWKGYHMVGTKKKNGRTVPNCVPGTKGAANESRSHSWGVALMRSGPREQPVV